MTALFMLILNFLAFSYFSFADIFLKIYNTLEGEEPKD